ncbi:MAG: hypothetical protein AUH88_00600 [Acidobacteria bacterium 13_1_40CM_4_61_5]|nr:MAG: hypothetical protein AUH88_00600 [Acidobacteria bacterium 13_1_40CM_4_61_5]OLE84067.1 MAG: hypothetical protein AUG07_07135 [Acidobacteria bacterium 13_1_20CM_2_60_10]
MQHLLWIFQHLLELVAVGSQDRGRQLRRHLHTGNTGILGHVANLVDLDTRVAGQSRLQLLRHLRGLRIPCGKCPGKTRKLRLCQRGREVNAGDPGGGQKLRKTPLGRAGPQRLAVKKDLVAGRAEQDTASPARLQCARKLAPRRLKLRSRADVPKLIKPGEFQ